ncbi:MAG: RidA family protein [Candidatus Anaerobiospirillum merdipullorum]|uniref:RidA family protein n=1 Tax=Candidatus Anaerobiospirillum merdipullorum TaxID=2838450 RepID=A0A9E2NRC3_9GAMM|nr:RidA family protein [Candidatus Anaerobiospirillum merdipullorum]
MKEVITSANAPQAIGPYSAALKTGELIFVSGQLPLDPSSGTMPEGIAAQTAQSLANLKALLEAAGSGLDKVVKTTVFLQHISDFAAMNEVYAKTFAAPYPTRSAFEVAALPKGALVEIECIALAK